MKNSRLQRSPRIVAIIGFVLYFIVILFPSYVVLAEVVVQGRSRSNNDNIHQYNNNDLNSVSDELHHQQQFQRRRRAIRGGEIKHSILTSTTTKKKKAKKEKIKQRRMEIKNDTEKAASTTGIDHIMEQYAKNNEIDLMMEEKGRGMYVNICHEIVCFYNKIVFYFYYFTT